MIQMNVGGVLVLGQIINFSAPKHTAESAGQACAAGIPPFNSRGKWVD